MNPKTSHKTLVALLAVLVLSGQVFASVPGICGCSGSEPDGSSCCSVEEANTTSDCCCGSLCGVEQTECGCGCSDSESDENQAPVEENRISEQLVAGNPSATVERLAIPRMPQWSAEKHSTISVSVASTQILYCVWQT